MFGYSQNRIHFAVFRAGTRMGTTKMSSRTSRLDPLAHPPPPRARCRSSASSDSWFGPWREAYARPSAAVREASVEGEGLLLMEVGRVRIVGRIAADHRRGGWVRILATRCCVRWRVAVCGRRASGRKWRG